MYIAGDLTWGERRVKNDERRRVNKEKDKQTRANKFGGVCIDKIDKCF